MRLLACDYLFRRLVFAFCAHSKKVEAAPSLGVLLSLYNISFPCCAGAKKAECGSCMPCSCFRRLTVCIPLLRRREEGGVRLMQELLLLLGALLSVFPLLSRREGGRVRLVQELLLL